MRKLRRSEWSLGCTIVVLVVVAALVFAPSPRPDNAELLRQARLALRRQDFAKAESLATTAGQDTQCDPWTWMVAAEAAVGTGRFSDALAYYEHVVQGEPDLRTAAAHGRGEMCLQLGRWQRAETEYLAALDIDPNNLLARRRLADLYNLSGRRQRAVPLMEQLIGTTAGSLEDLFYLGDVDHGVQLPDAFRTAPHDRSADPMLQTAQGYDALAENRNHQALQFFNLAIHSRPDNPDVVAGLGQAMIHLDAPELASWRRRVSAEMMNDAGVLSVLGQLEEREHRFDDAVQAFARAAALRPGSRIAWHRFGLSLSRIGRTNEASIALTRAQELQQIALWLDDLFQHRQQTDLIHRLVMQLTSMGRTAEATAWCHYVLQNSPQNQWAAAVLTSLQNAPKNLTSGDREAALVSMLHDLTSGNWQPQTQLQPRVPTMAAGETKAQPDPGNSHQFRFNDDAEASGLRFVHHSAREPSTLGARIIETTGGGVGVFDCDADGWPDVYFPQGSSVFPVPSANPLRDRLFRNHQGVAWDDVSEAAGADDASFSQGVAVGDFDNDGFADVYVANYGVNRLLHNQGDGTLQDVTPDAMRLQPVWTTSCVIVDVNADGEPDLFDVTYCRGANVETLICEQQGQPRSCSPRAFAAETDRLWLNSGDGRWKKSVDDGLDLADGLGLGVVAFRPTPDEPLTLFVANDEAPNYWLIRRPESPVGRPAWDDHAAVSGLAVDADGKPQACMGIAADDFDGNGLIDLLVTNFYQESNTLYAAVSPGFYDDQTRVAGLREPSWNQLGFGTQFIDADLDTWPDLVVANGHIDDLTSIGQPFEMPVQFFGNSAGRFVEVQNSTELPPQLGRAMARLDWNRDGREDLVIANQESPARLLTNSTETRGCSLRLQFRATSSARDAIGTIVHLQIGERTLTRQLTAGDGYMASNERQLVIGVGAVDKVESLDIFWPNGVRQQCGALNAPGSYLIVEQLAPLAMDEPQLIHTEH